MENVKVQTLLGIFIDNTLSWTHQVSHIRKNVNSRIALLKRVSYYLTYKMKVMFYNAYIQSMIVYCCQIWNKAKNANHIRKISKANSWNYFKQINKKEIITL